MTEENEEKFIDLIVVPPSPVEFRLYYGEDGKVICYTCESLDGQYIVVDSQTFAEARQDVLVINGKIISTIQNVVISKIKPNVTGTATTTEDVSIIANDETTNKTYWKLHLDELK